VLETFELKNVLDSKIQRVSHRY